MRGHIVALDGLRGIAILLVLAAHVQVSPTTARVDQMFDFLRGLGSTGVDLFFVLSGFLITGLLLEAKGAPGYFRSFYARRILRIFPLYYLTLACMFFVAPHLGTAIDARGLEGKEWWYWLYLENVSNLVNGVPATAFGRAFGHLWSLSVEEQAYLIWPVVVLLVSRTRLVWVCAGAVAFAPLFRLALVLAGVGIQGPYELTPSRIDTFAIGAALAVLMRHKRGLAVFGRWPWVLLAVNAVVLLGIAKKATDGGDTRLMEVVGYSASALFFGALLALSLTRRRVGSMLELPILRLFGKYSYAIYLFHLPLWAVLEPRLWQPDQPPTVLGLHLPAQLLAYAIMLVLSLVGGWLSWTLIERHILALKRFVPYSHVAAEPQSARLAPIDAPARLASIAS